MLLYAFICFFLLGIYLSVFNIELFAAFLWLVECSVLFIFLLLLFYLNVKNVFNYSNKNLTTYILTTPLFLYILFLHKYSVFYNMDDITLYIFFDNYYESLSNVVQNDLFGFLISYYIFNSFEFLVIGFMLLVGSFVCVNLYRFEKNSKTQNYFNFGIIFNFFNDFSNFLFLRKQNITKQGNNKSTLKIFKKK